MAGYIESRNGNNGTISGIYRSQGVVEAGALKELITRASGFINNDDVRYYFIKNAEAFTEAQLECINGESSLEEKNLALSYLRQEQEYLEQQILWLDSKQIKPAASVEIKIINGVISYIVKSIGLIGGIAQVISGGVLLVAGSPTVIGSAIGVLLILHGANNIMENTESLFFGNDNFKGPLTLLYEDAASSLGFDRAYGRLAFAGIDLVLSGTALFGTKLVAEPFRLFHYIPLDYEMGFRTMSVIELSAEIFPDSATIFSGTQTYFSIPVTEPSEPPQPLLPFHDY